MARRVSVTVLLLLIAVLLPTAQTPYADTLDIYWIDVEGGAATLIVTPEGRTILMDAGWEATGDRDARRIQVALADAHATRVDFFIASHFHPDHAGGVPALARAVPIESFIDHGDSVEQDRDRSGEAWAGYLSVARGKRRMVKPGDKLPITELEIMFVASNGEVISTPLEPRGPNSACRDAQVKDDDPFENGRSVGYLLSLGAFQMLNLGDLSWNLEHRLGCPENKLGSVDIYQVTHHGGNDAAAPQLVWALGPTVAVINNGPRKGGIPFVLDTLRKSPGLEGVWQLHRALAADARNTEDALIANSEEEESCRGHWIKAMVHPDGRSYTVINGRTGFSRTYVSR